MTGLSHDQLRALREMQRHGCWDQRVHLPPELWDEDPEGVGVLSDDGRAALAAQPDPATEGGPPMNFAAAQEIAEPMDYSPIRSVDPTSLAASIVKRFGLSPDLEPDLAEFIARMR